MVIKRYIAWIEIQFFVLLMLQIVIEFKKINDQILLSIGRFFYRQFISHIMFDCMLSTHTKY